ncbi:MAG: hypothetical protein KDD11_23285 [Acidobacteria bacterium]|nr:hypothetical protein [Acidobacteriota bacterium]
MPEGASAEELRRLVEEDRGELDIPTLRLLLRHPYTDGEVIEAIVRRPRWLSAYELRRDLARHPKTPPVHALRFLGGLYWRDLVELSLDPRLKPTLRRRAEEHVVERLSGLSLGEKMALARRAGHGILHRLRHDGHRRVIGALLENPRLTQGVLMPLASHESTPPEILRQIAENPRWGVLYAVRLALSRNPRTPPVVACGLLSGLRKGDLRAVADNPRLDTQVRRRAALLLGDGASRTRRP